MDKVCVIALIIMVLGAFAIGIYESNRVAIEAQKLCGPFRVKHHYIDQETGKTHAVCAAPSERDEFR